MPAVRGFGVEPPGCLEEGPGFGLWGGLTGDGGVIGFGEGEDLQRAEREVLAEGMDDCADGGAGGEDVVDEEEGGRVAGGRHEGGDGEWGRGIGGGSGQGLRGEGFGGDRVDIF